MAAPADVPPTLSSLTRRELGAAASAALVAGIAAPAARAATPAWPYLIGADISCVPEDWPIVQGWMDNLLERGVRFDATGFSCYQQQAEGDWERCFAEFARSYPDHGFLVLEYSSRKRYLNDLVRAHSRGWGSFIWEPTRHQEAIFLRDGRNAGSGPRPDLLSQGLNTAEAPGSTPPTTATPPPRRQRGGRYDADPAFLDLYRTMARDYGLALPPAASDTSNGRP